MASATASHPKPDGPQIPARSAAASDAMLASVRARAAQIFSKLDADCSGTERRSWVRGDGDSGPSSSGSPATNRCRYFDRHGFLLVKGFSDADTEVAALKEQMEALAEGWDPSDDGQNSVFRTDEGQIDAQGSDDYFLASASRVHFFAEKDATTDDGKLRRQFLGNKMAALNKMGHGMHMTDGPFRDYATSAKVRTLVRELGWVDPVVPQSMYIFKQPLVGGEVTSHQDSTFLYTEPRQTCLGLWLALDDATLENGCLWVRPGSHREPVRRKFARNREHFGNDALERGSNAAAGDKSKPQMIFENLLADDDEAAAAAVPWEGKLPDNSQPPCDGLFEAGFVPVECRAGDLLAFPGTLDHLSLPNYSPLQRHTFQLHLVEGPGAGITWSKSNWLQYPEGMDFLSIK